MELSELINNYMEYLKYEQQGSSSTCKVRYADLQKFRKYMKQEMGVENIEHIKVFHLRSYIFHLSSVERCKPVTLNNIITGLRVFYSFAIKQEIIENNIAEKIRKPKIEDEEVEHFSWEEVEKLCLAVPVKANYLRDICILLFFYYSGARLNEVRNIKLKDFSPDLSELTIYGKGDKTRLLPVHSFLQRVLRLYLKGRRKDSSYLFPGRNVDKPLNEKSIYSIVKKYGKKVGIEKRVSPHIFRHSFATHLHQKGIDINRLAQLLGHANIEKTARYTHTEYDELKEAVIKL